MSCGQSELWMMDALDGALEAPERQQLQNHLNTCVRCRTEWEALQAVESILGNPPVLHPSAGMVQRVEARIIQAEAQRRTLLGGLILLGAAVALCLLAVPSLLNGRSPLDAYTDFVGTSYDLIAGLALVGYRLLVAVWFILDTLARSVDIPLANLLTYAVGLALAVAAWRRAARRIPVQRRQRGS